MCQPDVHAMGSVTAPLHATRVGPGGTLVARAEVVVVVRGDPQRPKLGAEEGVVAPALVIEPVIAAAGARGALSPRTP